MSGGRMTMRSRTFALLAGTLLAGSPPAGPALAQDAPPNAERAAGAPGAGFAEAGFSISVDGAPIAGAAPPPVPQRAQDTALARAAVDVTFDGLETARRLAVAADRAAARPGETVTFRAGTNYPAYVARAEIVVTDRGAPGAPVVAVIPVAPNGAAAWTVPAGAPDAMAYALRVTDARGRRDETRPVPLARGAGADAFVPPVLTDDATLRRGIPAAGGIVTVSGTATPGGTVRVMGETVPVDPDGTFAVDRILPPGDHMVVVEAGGRRLVRDVRIPRGEWFGTGIVDVTLGRERGGPRDEHRDVTDARVAYYVKGRTASGWTVTSSADTQEGDIEDLFDRLNDKDPRRVLDRLRAEADDLYPTYGDDSTAFDDTPTAGNVYLRVENETTRLTFGDFAAGVTGPGLIQNTRDLYGLELRNRSAAVTSEGDARYAVTVYAAQPDTLPQRDVLTGTNGSIYFLSRRDVLYGTVKATVQVRDPATGFVVETRTLTEGRDFQVDHLQGVVTLSGPLPGFASDDTLIDEGGADYVQALVVQYEYTPTGNVPDQTALGGRAEAWVTDRLRFGVTAMRENTGTGEDQDMAGVDLFWRLGETSFVQAELARTDGPGIDRALSDDGGLTIGRDVAAPGDDADAMGLRATGRLAFADLGLGADGHLGFRLERLEAGFSTLTEDIESDRDLIGLDAAWRVGPRAEITAAFEDYDEDGGEERTEGELALGYALSERLFLRAGIGRLDRDVPGDADETGSRTDAGLRLTYDVNDDVAVSVFGQTTVERDGLRDNDRLGAGIRARLGERLAIEAEASDGDLGEQAEARLVFNRGPGAEAYLGYTLDPSRGEDDLRDRGTLVLGARDRLSESVQIWTESVLDRPGGTRKLTRAYGLSWAPSAAFTLSGSLETGTVRGGDDDGLTRDAVSVGAAYVPGDDVAMRARLEWREDDGAGIADDRETWGLIAGYSNQVSAEWRLLMDVEALYSDGADGDFRDGEYLDGAIGFAYRPIANERLNLLFGLRHLRDLPGADQVTAAGGTEGPEQRSTVASLNASYDLSQRLTLGAKLAYRSSEVADRGSDVFVDDRATLTALRLDWHALHQWDVLGEVRSLRGLDTGETGTGALLGVYRRVNDNVKVGLVYEWGDVSDDVTDLDYDNQGLFLNIVGTF